MQVIYERCCGMDVHKKIVVVCVITPEGREIRSFGTMTADLLQLVDWVTSKGCTHAAMESTGVYWKPVYNLLENSGIEVLVVNAKHIKAVPGRKTDVKDAEWIADLLRHGLLKGSYIPDRDQRELRELVRYRKSLVNERSREGNRVQAVLEGANIKLGSVASDVLGVSGRAMLRAMIEGTTDPVTLAAMAKGRLRKKETMLEQSLHGLLGPHQRMMLDKQLGHIDFLDQQIEELSQEIARRMDPFREALDRVQTIPGVGRKGAEQILAETGVDMSRFPTAAHLASWAKVCPGNNESAGKRKSGRTGHGNAWLRHALVEVARAASRTKNTYVSAQYRRIAARRGANRAAVAVAHTILVIIYHILTRGTTYQELGANFYDERDKQAVARRAVKRLEQLGYKVAIEAA